VNPLIFDRITSILGCASKSSITYKVRQRKKKSQEKGEQQERGRSTGSINRKERKEGRKGRRKEERGEERREEGRKGEKERDRKMALASSSNKTRVRAVAGAVVGICLLQQLLHLL